MTDTTPTPADRPADQLRAAAEKLRAASMGSPMNSSPWRYAKGLPSDSVRTEAGWEVVYGDAPGDLRYIALMHPGVGLALADWLEREAEIWQVIDDASAHPEETGLKVTVGASTHAEALAVARQLLGTNAAEPESEPCGSLSQPTYSGEIMRCVLPVGHPRQCQSTTEYPWVSWPSPTAQADLLVTEMHRLALSEALGLGTGAPWDAIRDRAAELVAAPPAPADRAATLTAVADEVEQVFLGELNDERALSLHDALIVLRSKLPCTCARSQGLHAKGCQRYVAGHDLLSPVLRLARAREDLSRLAADAAAGVQPPTSEADTVLAAALDGLGTLIATSSRDWGTYRVDAWIWAVLVGWDCEQAVHDETCTHGAMEEMAGMHGWDAATVAKARRYRAAVRALATPPAAPAAPEETQ
ncbi:hypothetical protein [Streptomyces rubiginosohelvolus]|uniref:Uncharacterized protein n=1 Tax=Streptomyces rubiginosohelvolus TaxID=67362 RepID=A0ABQ3CBM7_9ACTN|nr:hypothetical protein [Streptomyces pluricolorescens]GGZ84119.1 hypothetical protein GCM10010328_67720 [Streptomyces pluricolorescens]